MRTSVTFLALFLGLAASAQFTPVFNVNSGEGFTTIEDAMNAANPGDLIELASTTFTEHVVLNKSVTLRGPAEGVALIDVSQADGWGITINSDNVTLEHVTVLGGGSNTAYAIHSEPGITGLKLDHVNVFDSNRSCIDLNGLTGPSLNQITNIQVAGSAIGYGLALSSCSDVLVENVVSTDNGFGDIAIMLSNYYDQELVNLTFQGDLSLEGPESLGGGGIVVQVPTGQLSPGIGPGFALNISANGFKHLIEAPGDLSGCIVVHEDDVRGIASILGGNIQNLTSYDLFTQRSMVYPGMKVQAAVDQAEDGDIIEVVAGDFDSTAVVIDGNITLIGANAGVEGNDAANRGAESRLAGLVVTGGSPTIDGLHLGAASANAVEVNSEAMGLTLRNSVLTGDDDMGSTGVVGRGAVAITKTKIRQFGQGVRQESGTMTLEDCELIANNKGFVLDAGQGVNTTSNLQSCVFQNAGGTGVEAVSGDAGNEVIVTNSTFNSHGSALKLNEVLNFSSSGSTYSGSEVQVEGLNSEQKTSLCGANIFEPAIRIAGCTDAQADNYSSCATVNFSCEYLGCTSPKACNYDSTANVDDGSCDFLSCAGCPLGFACNYDPNSSLYKVEACDFSSCEGEGMATGGTDREGLSMVDGCTIAQACNYDPNATANDGSCVFDCYGCMDNTACNFEVAFTQASNETCLFKADLFPSPYVNCDGVCNNDANGNGVCDEAEISGCTDFEACNFLAEATLDDSSCEFSSCAGCTSSDACNYDAEALISNGTCDYQSCRGCMDPSACNHDATATFDDGSCSFPVDLFNKTYVDCVGDCINDTNNNGVCDEVEEPGCFDSGACNFDENATVDDGSCEYSSCAGCTDPSYCNYDPGASLDDGNCLSAGDLFPEFVVAGTAVVDCVGRCLNDSDNDGICDELEVVGCQDTQACNYNESATDEGECTYPGPVYDCDGGCINDSDGDGICDEDEIACPGDLNGDGIRGAADILVMLSAFGCTLDCGVADLNGDGLVAASDILEALSFFGVDCSN